MRIAVEFARGLFVLIFDLQLKLSFQDAQNRSLAVFRVPGRNVVR